jgi:hypothetical protein
MSARSGVGRRANPEFAAPDMVPEMTYGNGSSRLVHLRHGFVNEREGVALHASDGARRRRRGSILCGGSPGVGRWSYPASAARCTAARILM